MAEENILYSLYPLFIDKIAYAMLAGIGAGLIVKFVISTNSEKIFNNNRKKTLHFLFSKISLIDSYKQTIYNYWQNQEYYKNSNSMIVLESETYKEIIRYRGLILDCIKEITLYKKSPYLAFDDYLVIQQYAWSAYSHFHEISNLENGIGIDNKTLEYHRYYAKLIIEKFKKLTPKYFKEDWTSEFDKQGGSQFIKQPEIQPGDIVGTHHNFQNEILNYDAQFGTMMKLLREIKGILEKN